jgi:hypothetical protein
MQDKPINIASHLKLRFRCNIQNYFVPQGSYLIDLFKNLFCAIITIYRIDWIDL